MTAQRYYWASRGDVNAFFGLTLENVADPVLMVGLLSTGFGFPATFALRYMVPGTAVGVLRGDLPLLEILPYPVVGMVSLAQLIPILVSTAVGIRRRPFQSLGAVHESPHDFPSRHAAFHVAEPVADFRRRSLTTQEAAI